MFRIFSCIALCALPLAMSSPAAAQSYISVTDETEVASPVSLGPPMSITQRYVPSTPSQTRDLSLLVDESQPAASPAAISVTSPAPAPMARMAVNDLGIGRRTIVVSNVRGLNE
jgi:hypothetical protein